MVLTNKDLTANFYIKYIEYNKRYFTVIR